MKDGDFPTVVPGFFAHLPKPSEFEHPDIDMAGYTPRARGVIECAVREARFQKVLGTYHVLWGILEDPTSVAVHVLKNLNVDLQKVKDKLLGAIRVHETTEINKYPPPSDGVHFVANRAREEARGFGHGNIGPEHLLLALLALPATDLAVHALAESGLQQTEAREELANVLGLPHLEWDKILKEAKVAIGDWPNDPIAMSFDGVKKHLPRRVHVCLFSAFKRGQVFDESLFNWLLEETK
jgi:hypothetical protein